MPVRMRTGVTAPPNVDRSGRHTSLSVMDACPVSVKGLGAFAVPQKQGEAMPKIKRNSGFTLMEMMMVVAIITISAAVTGFSLKSMLPDLRLSQAARDLKSDLNMARLRAVRENKFVWIVFHDEAPPYYDIFIDNGDEKYSDEEMEEEILIKTVDLPRGISLDTASFMPGGTNKTCFNSRGLADTRNGTASLVNEKEVQQAVHVAKTGRVTIEKILK